MIYGSNVIHIFQHNMLFLGDENDLEELKHLEPREIKVHMKTILENMDQNKNGFIEKQELSDKLLETYR